MTLYLFFFVSDLSTLYRFIISFHLFRKLTEGPMRAGRHMFDNIQGYISCSSFIPPSPHSFTFNFFPLRVTLTITTAMTKERHFSPSLIQFSSFTFSFIFLHFTFLLIFQIYISIILSLGQLSQIFLSGTEWSQCYERV